VNRVLTFLWGAVFVAMGSLAVAALYWPEWGTTLGFARFLLLLPAILATVRLPREAARLRIENVDAWRSRTRLAAMFGIFVAVSALVTTVVSF
jgi:hypothetical protein